MNHDDNKPDLQPLIERELEARIVAWVSGEASAFEAAELERLTGEKPELAIFKHRIEAVRGLVAEAIRPDKKLLLLSPERRVKLLQAIGAAETKATAAIPSESALAPLLATKRAQRRDRRWMLSLAACLTVGLFTVLSIPGFRKYRAAQEMAKSALPSNSEPREESLPVDLPVAMNPESVAVADATPMLEAPGLDRSLRDVAARELAIKQAVESSSRRKSERETANLNWSAREADKRPGATDRLVFDGLQAKATPSAPALAGDFANSSYGYFKEDTLAGTRARTELKDVASSVSVNTKQLLREASALSAGDRLTYSPATEVGGATRNYYGAGGTGNKPNSPAGSASLVRGFDDQRVTGEMKPVLPSFGRDGEEVVALSPFVVTSDKAAAGKKSDRPEDDRQVAPAPKPPLPIPDSAEVSASKEPVSTFSLHVSDVSFRLVQAALAKDEAIDRERIRPEEFYNAFDYGDPTPTMADKVSCRIEQAAHPFLQQRNLVRIALKVAASGRDAAQPLRLTVLLDTSGSMEREDRAAVVHRAMESLVSLLGPNDRLTLIGFARQPRLLVESLPGDKSGQILDIVAHTPAEGGTNLEEALKLGRELAQRQFDPAAQNRIVLLTDGAANLGNADPAQLAAAIEALRQQGIAFDACGIGLAGLDDAMLESLTRKGDGRYYVLNSPEAADANFAQQLAGAFRPAAENVKLQVRFNPARVGHYRLIGFEQHRLREEDFRNDRVDAAELAAEEAAVAVYQVEALPQGEGELGEVYVRFRDPASGNMVERSWTLAYDAHSPAFDRATPSLQLAGASALFAEILRGEAAEVAPKLGELVPVMNKLRGHYANEPRVQQLVTMFEQARRLAGQ